MIMVQSGIKVVPYDDNWPTMFEIEKSIIAKALGENCIKIYHIGSTSVPGLLAKPVIDIIVIARDRTSAITSLESVGYAYKGEWNIPFKCGFGKKENVDVNLHMFFDENHPEIELNLLFRDYLRSNPDVCSAYAATKMEILSKENSNNKVGKLSFPVYTLEKRAFIDSILKKIGFNRFRFVKCLTDDEWNTAKTLRQKYFFDDYNIQDTYISTFDHKDHEHLLLYKGVEVIGYAHIQLLSELKAILRVIVLTKEYQNSVIISEFLSTIEKWLIIHNYSCLYIESLIDELMFYKKHGYVEMQLGGICENNYYDWSIVVGKFF